MSIDTSHTQSSITHPDAVYEQLARDGGARGGRRGGRSGGLSTATKAVLLVVCAVIISGISFVAGLQTGKKTGTTAGRAGQMGNFGGGYGRMTPPSGSGQMPSGFPDQSGDSSTQDTMTN